MSPYWRFAWQLARDRPKAVGWQAVTPPAIAAVAVLIQQAASDKWTPLMPILSGVLAGIFVYLTEQGWMDPALLYASPFIDLNPRGVEGLFTSGQVTSIVSIL